MAKSLLLAKKIWNFLIHEDSWASFIADAVLIIIIGKFLLFPGMGLALGTEFPVVAVVSNSMNHQGLEVEDWWDSQQKYYREYNITKSDFGEFELKNGFEKGDVVVIKGEEFSELEPGDVIVFSVQSKRDPIIHRIVLKRDTFVSTKGDANLGQIYFERRVSSEQIQGKATYVIPYIGWLKVGLMEIIGLI